MHDAKAAWETRLRRDESIGCGLSKQLLGGGEALGTNIARIRKGDPRACAQHVSQAINAERIAFADKQRDPAILAEEAPAAR